MFRSIILVPGLVGIMAGAFLGVLIAYLKPGFPIVALAGLLGLLYLVIGPLAWYSHMGPTSTKRDRFVTSVVTAVCSVVSVLAVHALLS